MKRDIEIKAVREDGEVMDYESDIWGIIAVDGIDFNDIEIFRQPKSFGHGDIISGKRKKSRDITIQAKLRNNNLYARTRQRVIGFHNSNYKYDIFITYLGVTRIAKDCVLNTAHYGVTKRHKSPVLSLMYSAPEADLFSNNIDSTSFISKNPLWHDTRVFAKNQALPYGQIVRATERTINYLGSEPTPIKAIISATGYVNKINVSLRNHKLVIDETLSKGDVLEIDGVTRLVKKNGKLISFSKYDANMLYKLQLEYGDNLVKIDSGDNTAFSAEIEYEGRYGGL